MGLRSWRVSIQKTESDRAGIRHSITHFTLAIREKTDGDSQLPGSGAGAGAAASVFLGSSGGSGFGATFFASGVGFVTVAGAGVGLKTTGAEVEYSG